MATRRGGSYSSSDKFTWQKGDVMVFKNHDEAKAYMEAEKKKGAAAKKKSSGATAKKKK